jgi:ubiquinone/menaquinone biosynthesis C-methylase UbiE
MCLDIGAGGGDDCSRMTGVGLPRHRIVGVDLLARRLRDSRRSHPWLSVIQGDARHLPFRPGSLSLVYQSTMLSSVLDGALRKDILAEIVRVLRPGGHFLSFDTRYRNPWNPHTRPVPASELREAFAGWRLWIRSANGIPQLIRLLAPVSLALCRAVESLPVLRSHLLVLARKPEA